MEEKRRNHLRALYRTWTTEALVESVQRRKEDYDPEALLLMQSELASRSVSVESGAHATPYTNEEDVERKAAVIEAMLPPYLLSLFFPPLASSWEAGRYVGMPGDFAALIAVLQLGATIIFAIYGMVTGYRHLDTLPQLIMQFSVFNLGRALCNLFVVILKWNVFVRAQLGGQVGQALGGDLGYALVMVGVSVMLLRRQKKSGISSQSVP